jgi:hypothetical protein
MVAATAKLSSRQHIPSEEGYKSVEKIHVSFFMVKYSKNYINVLGVGPVGTRTMTFTVGEKPPRGTRGIKRV